MSLLQRIDCFTSNENNFTFLFSLKKSNSLDDVTQCKSVGKFCIFILVNVKHYSKSSVRQLSSREEPMSCVKALK